VTVVSGISSIPPSSAAKSCATGAPASTPDLFAKASALVALGLAIGLAAAVVVTRAMTSMLYGVNAAHPATYAAGVFLLALAALLSVWIPGRRATRLDPMTVLRGD
jgi:ABC-type antimicrobial peptide transport system permease subunit